LDGFTTEFYQTFRELTPMLLKLLHKPEREGMLPNLFCEANITFIPKPDKATRKSIDQFQIDRKILSKILAK
jgi:hypothetical protein